MSWAIGKDPELPNMMISYSASIAKDKFYITAFCIKEYAETTIWGITKRYFHI